MLVVEDEYLLADDLSQTLRASGAQVVGPVASIEAALKQVQNDGFEVAVLDINLRDKMAYPVADELQEHRVPFVFATGYDAAEIPPRFSHVPRWEKPFDVTELMADIGRLCALR